MRCRRLPMFLTKEMTVKSNYTIKEFGVFCIGIILYIKIETENSKKAFQVIFFITECFLS